jgi:hypothetical protein
VSRCCLDNNKKSSCRLLQELSQYITAEKPSCLTTVPRVGSEGNSTDTGNLGLTASRTPSTNSIYISLRHRQKCHSFCSEHETPTKTIHRAFHVNAKVYDAQSDRLYKSPSPATRHDRIRLYCIGIERNRVRKFRICDPI